MFRIVTSMFAALLFGKTIMGMVDLVPSSKPSQQPTEEPNDILVYGFAAAAAGSLSECPSNSQYTYGKFIECETDPCGCDEPDLHCGQNTCDNNGCYACDNDNGYFKMDYGYKCANCQSIFGDSCLECGDFVGCIECDALSTQTYDHNCDLYYCVPIETNAS